MVAFFKKNIYDYNLREKKLDEDIIRWGIFYIYVSIWDNLRLETAIEKGTSRS